MLFWCDTVKTHLLYISFLVGIVSNQRMAREVGGGAWCSCSAKNTTWCLFVAACDLPLGILAAFITGSNDNMLSI